MEFRLLGPFEVVDGGVAIALGGRRQRAVLALLTIHAGEVLSTDRIVDEVWAGSPPPSAVRTVHAYVSRLRSVLHASDSRDGDADILISREPGYLVAVDKSQIDAFRFERAVDEATAWLAAGQAEAAAQGLRDALGIWRGTALADFAYEPFAANESLRLMERRLEAVERRIDADLMLARHASVVAELDGLVAEHPMREGFWEQLMTALYRCGRQAEALAAYGRVRRTLVEELGIEPGPGLRRLERLVLEQSAELAWHPVGDGGTTVGNGASGAAARSGTLHPGAVSAASASSAPTGPDTIDDGLRSGPSLLPLVGRDAHLERLANFVHSAPAGARPRLVLIMGEAGCGKSRLLAEFGSRAWGEGVLVAASSAERDSSLPYGPFAQMVRSVLNTCGADTLERVGHLRADLAWLIPDVGPPPSAGVEDLGLARTRMFEAVLQLLATAGNREPLLLFVDDAHRLGEGSMALVQAMLDRTWSRPVVVVMACRTEPGERRTRVEDPLLDLLRREGTISMEVGRLSVTDLATLVGHLEIRDPGTDPSKLARRLGERTGGIPLLVREVLAGGDAQGDPAVLIGGTGTSVSPLVQGVIGHRLEEMSHDTQRLLEVASVIGMEFDVDVVATVTGSQATEVVELFEEALEAGVVAETARFNRYAFDHGLIRDVVVNSVSANRQIRLHGRVAEVLATRGAEVEAARHGLVGYAGITAETAVVLALRGADVALASLEFELASSLCSDALAGPAEDLDGGVRSDLLLRLGRAESLSGHPEEAESAWRSAAELARAAGDVDRLAHIALGTDPHGHMLTTSSDLRWSLLTEALEKTGPQWSRLRLLVASEWLTEAVMPARRALTPELVFEVVDAATELGDPYALAAAYHARHVLARTRHLPMRRQWSDELRTVAEELGDDKWLFQGYVACLIDAVVEADADATERALDQLRLTCARYRVPRGLWTFELAAASCARLRGQFEIADEHTSAAADLGERHGIMDNPAAMGAIAFLNAFHRGGLGTLRTVLEQFSEMVPDVAAWAFGAGLAAAADHDLDAARAALGRGMDVLTDSPEVIWLTSLCLAAELVGWVGAEESTVSRVTGLLEPYAGQFAVIGTLSSEFGPTDRGLGLLSAARGDIDRADECFAAAVGACQRLQARPWELRTRTDWLVVDRAAGRAPQAWWEGLEAELEMSGLGGALARLHEDTGEA